MLFNSKSKCLHSRHFTEIKVHRKNLNLLRANKEGGGGKLESKMLNSISQAKF